MVFTLKIWRHYLYGAHCEMFTDHLNLQYVFSQKDLNLRRRRWIELVEDYDITILYHPGKANMVADALSQKSVNMGNLTCLEATRRPMAKEVQTLAKRLMRLSLTKTGGILACIEAKSSLLEEIKDRKFEDDKLSMIRDKVLWGEVKEAVLDGKGVIRIKGRVCVL